MRRKNGEFFEHEIDILQAAQESEGGIHPYGFVREYGENMEHIHTGAVYKRFRRLAQMGMLVRSEPVQEGQGTARVPYMLTELGGLALSENIVLQNIE